MPSTAGYADSARSMIRSKMRPVADTNDVDVSHAHADSIHSKYPPRLACLYRICSVALGALFYRHD